MEKFKPACYIVAAFVIVVSIVVYITLKVTS